VKYFQVTKGSHFVKNREYKQGDIVSSERDLTKIFVGKFVEVAAPITTAVNEVAAPVPAPAAPAVVTPFGADVTASFPEAGVNDLQVFQKSSHFYVVDPDKPTAALNTKALKKAEVSDFIKKFIHPAS
jgi:hypothetical protein